MANFLNQGRWSKQGQDLLVHAGQLPAAGLQRIAQLPVLRRQAPQVAGGHLLHVEAVVLRRIRMRSLAGPWLALSAQQGHIALEAQHQGQLPH